MEAPVPWSSPKQQANYPCLEPNQFSPFQSTPSILLRIHFYIIHPSTSRSSNWSLSFRFLNLQTIFIFSSPLQHKQTDSPNYSAWLDPPNNFQKHFKLINICLYFSKNKMVFCLFTESLSYIAVILSSVFRDEPKFCIRIATTNIAVRIYSSS